MTPSSVFAPCPIHSHSNNIYFAEYLDIYETDFPQIFRVFAGYYYDFESVKISKCVEGILREGVGRKKKFDPNFLPLGGPGPPNFFHMGVSLVPI